ncbi:MAG: hypothetical protein AAGA16_02220 [Cyanobacteria bacterium P01_E01_bin.35]
MKVKVMQLDYILKKLKADSAGAIAPKRCYKGESCRMSRLRCKASSKDKLSIHVSNQQRQILEEEV